MRLINVETLRLEEYFGRDIPQYTILSHCWGKDEVSFQDFNGASWQKKLGSIKIQYASNQTKKDHFRYLWVDTCCIDKSSSAELSEAINSMYRWYKRATICYAYLEDVMRVPSDSDAENFSISRWFTRGWTLQELIAPPNILFFGVHWLELGYKTNLLSVLVQITEIPRNVLEFSEIVTDLSIAKRMSFAAKRTTTRVEDMAYCLLGIFDITMPLLYGEGYRAFERLQEELIRQSDDQTIFGWDEYFCAATPSCFASSPKSYSNWKDLVPIPSHGETLTYSMTNRGLHIQLPLLPASPGRYIAILNCHLALNFSGRFGIPLLDATKPTYISTPIDNTTMDNVVQPSVFERDMSNSPKIYTHEQVAKATVRTIYLLGKPAPRLGNYFFCRLSAESMKYHGFILTAFFPSDYDFNWSTETIGLKDSDGLHTILFEYTRTTESPSSLVVFAKFIYQRLSISPAYIFSNPTGNKLEWWFHQYRQHKPVARFENGVSVAPNNQEALQFKVGIREENVFNRKVFVIDIDC